MKEKSLNKIRSIIREMMATGSTAGAAGFSSSAPAEGPTAGFDPLLKKKKKVLRRKDARR